MGQRVNSDLEGGGSIRRGVSNSGSRVRAQLAVAGRGRACTAVASQEMFLPQLRERPIPGEWVGRLTMK